MTRRVNFLQKKVHVVVQQKAVLYQVTYDIADFEKLRS